MRYWKFIPLIFFILVVVFFFSAFFLHFRLPIPSDTIVGLYHPFRDLYAKDFPRGIPFKNFLITDPVRQEYPWRYLAIVLEKQMQIPLWNPYTFAGTPLLANFQSAAYYPLNILYFILPFQLSWSILVLSQPLLGGLFLYLYLKNLKLHPAACLLAALAFALSGSFVSWMEWNTLDHIFVWLPMILLAKDKLIERWNVRWTVIFLFSEIAAFLGGHLQILFYAFCVSNAYLAARIFQKAQQKRTNKNFAILMGKIYVPFLIAGLVMFTITTIQWMPTLQFIFQSARGLDQLHAWQQPGWFIPWQHLIQYIAPDFFGNPTTLNYWGVWNYGEFVGYVGIFPLIMALYAMFYRHDKKTFFFGTLFFLSLIFSLPTFFAILPYQLHIPFISTSAPTRLVFVTDFCLSILAALGFDYFLKVDRKRSSLIVTGLFGLIFFLLWCFVLFGHRYLFGISPENINVAKRNLLFPTFMYFCISIFLILMSVKKISFSKEMRNNQSKKFLVLSFWFSVSNILIIILLFLTAFDLIRFGQKFLPFTDSSYLFPNTQTLSFLGQNVGQFRIMSTSSEIFPPNFSIMYHLQTIDGYDPLYLLRYGELIAASERGKPDIHPPFGFNRIITPHALNQRIMNLLGVKYMLSLSGLSLSSLTKVYIEGETSIYQNSEVFPP